MTKHEVPKLFEDRKIRTVQDDKEEKWCFSIVEVVGVLTDQPDIEHARNYQKVLKHRLKKEGNKSVTNCNQLKLRSSDGKKNNVICYSLEMILAIGYRIRTIRDVQFRQWATRHLSEYLVKGFTMDDEQLKKPDGRQDYFDELMVI